MALIDQLLNEIRDEVIKDVPKPKVYNSDDFSDLWELLSPKLEELFQDMTVLRDEINCWKGHFTDGRTNICKDMAWMQRKQNNCIGDFNKIRVLLEDPQTAVKAANHASTEEYKLALVQASQDFVETELYTKIRQAFPEPVRS